MDGYGGWVDGWMDDGWVDGYTQGCSSAQVRGYHSFTCSGLYSTQKIKPYIMAGNSPEAVVVSM